MKVQSIQAVALFTVGISLALAGQAHAQATLAADYQFQSTYASSVGTIGPLSVVGNANDASFSTGVTVDGQSQIVLALNVNAQTPPAPDPGAGVQAQTAGFISSTNYSIVLLAEFNLSADFAATKLFDFDNLSSDDGLYVNDTTGLLYFNGAVGATGGTPAVSGTYTQIVLTRDSSTNTVTVYQDGSPAFNFDDSTGLAILGDSVSPSPNAYLTVFKDDDTGVGSTVLDETSVGDIARLRLYDGVLTPAQVAGLGTVVTPEPLAATTMLLSGGLLLRRRKRT